MIYLANAFSLSMLPGSARITADPIDRELSPEMGRYLADRHIQSVVGHQGTADVLAAKLGIDVPVNRVNLKVQYGDSVYVAQPSTRLAEGQVLSKEELEAVPMSFWVVTVMRPVGSN